MCLIGWGGRGACRSFQCEEQCQQDVEALKRLTDSSQYIEMKKKYSDNVDRLHIARARWKKKIIFCAPTTTSYLEKKKKTQN